jgi:hypothetical protein
LFDDSLRNGLFKIEDVCWLGGVLDPSEQILSEAFHPSLGVDHQGDDICDLV